MNKLAQLILIFALLALLLVSALMSGLIQSERWEIKQVDVAAQYQRVSAEQLRFLVKKTTERSFFRLDTNQVRESLESLNWVRSAHVVKQWPDTLKITLTEHQPMAVWNDTELLNGQGELFTVERIEDVSDLPRIYAPDLHAEAVYKLFNRFNRLLQPVGYEIGQANVSERGSWQLKLRNGLEIKIGTEQLEARTLRLAETWHNLLNSSDQLPQTIDLRYSNGYVVKWHPGLREVRPNENASNDAEVSS